MFFRMVYKSGQIFPPFCHNPRVWQTDRQTDGQTEFSSLYRFCITCSAVKIKRISFFTYMIHIIFTILKVVVLLGVCLSVCLLVGCLLTTSLNYWTDLHKSFYQRCRPIRGQERMDLIMEVIRIQTGYGFRIRSRFVMAEICVIQVHLYVIC